MAEQEFVVLFADVSGSMQLYETAGDEAAKSLVIGLQGVLTTLIEDQNGEVQEIIGDEVMARFGSPNHALSCATAIHKCAEQFSRGRPTALQMRIGVHIGSTIIEQERMFGDTVNLAARVASIAQGEQTIITETLIKRADPHWQRLARKFDVTRIKGKSEPVVIYDLPWHQNDLTVIQQAPSTATNNCGVLSLVYNDTTIELKKHEGPFSIGRALTNNLVVNAEPVSRRHTLIEHVRDRFVVTDKSTNGTHVYLNSGEVIYLRREQLPIWGEGQLSLGAPSNQAAGHVVNFSCRREEI